MLNSGSAETLRSRLKRFVQIILMQDTDVFDLAIEIDKSKRHREDCIYDWRLGIQMLGKKIFHLHRLGGGRKVIY